MTKEKLLINGKETEIFNVPKRSCLRCVYFYNTDKSGFENTPECFKGKCLINPPTVLFAGGVVNGNFGAFTHGNVVSGLPDVNGLHHCSKLTKEED